LCHAGQARGAAFEGGAEGGEGFGLQVELVVDWRDGDIGGRREEIEGREVGEVV
jgi:hypothetical protein